MPEPTILSSIEQICQEKKLSKEQVLEAIEQALASAYRKDFGNKLQNLKVNFEPEAGKMKVFDEKTVVEDLLEEKSSKTPPDEILPQKEKDAEEKETEEEKSSANLSAGVLAETETLAKEETPVKEEKHFNPKTEIQISEVGKSSDWQNLSGHKKIKIGDVIRQELKIPSDFGRIAAQTAKQVIIQRLREAERETIFEKYNTLIGSVISAVVQRREGRTVFLDLSDATAVMPYNEQAYEEKYWPEQKIKVYLVSINKTSKGPEIIVSRRHSDILKELFKLEIPEIANGTVKIKAIAREPGLRSKVAVFTSEKSIDPIGAAIGQRGIRIQTIINEIGGEKIDIIEYSDDPEKFIANALSPAKISSLKINKKEKSALVRTKKNQLSLAIGKTGQNVRLAAKLTGWKIDLSEEEEPPAPEQGSKQDKIEKKETKRQKNREQKEKKKITGKKTAGKKKD